MTKLNVTPPPNYRKSDPLSSMLAGDEVTNNGVRQNQCDAVFEAVQKSPRRTARELAEEFGIDRYAVSRRLADLAHQGLIRKSSSRTCEIGKRLSCTWAEIDKHQQELF